jgi:hypothetical protein
MAFCSGAAQLVIATARIRMRNDNGLDNGTIELTVRDEDRHILVVVQLLGFDG